MTKKEKYVLFLVPCLIIVVLSLIPDNPKSADGLKGPSPVDWSSLKNDPSQTLGLRWQGIISNPAGKEGSWIERNLENRFNIELDPIFMDGNAYEKRRPLMLVGGDVPDVMWSGDPLQLRANLRNGFVMEIPYEVILARCPTYVDLVNTYGKEAWLYTQFEGRNYGLPTVNAAANRPRISAWRMDWLRKVGIDKVPETVEEMHEAFSRFRFQDPDGNGKQDTYGWAPNISHWSLMFVEVLAAHDVLAFDLMEQEGEVVWGGLLPGAKESLRILRSWYAEGLIDPDFPLDSRGRQIDVKFINGRVGYMYPVDHPFEHKKDEEGSIYAKTLAFDPRAELAPGPPLRNSRGQRRGRTWGGAAHIMQFGKHLEKQPEKVIRVLDMMEAIASNEVLYMEARNGERGKHWDYFPEPIVRPDGKLIKEGINMVPPYDEKDRTRENTAELLGGNCTFFFPSTFEQLFDDAYLPLADREWIERNKKTEWGMMNVLGKSDVVTSSGRYLKDLVNYQMTVYIEIVIGDRDLDYFDEFASEWRRRGGDVILKEANEMYQKVHEIYDVVGVEEAE